MTFDPDLSRTSDLYNSLEDISLNTATYRRRVIIVLFDVSTSMAYTVGGKPRIDLLNEQLRQWLPMVREEGRGQLRDVEVAVVTFSGRGVRVITGDPSRPRGEAHTDGGAFVPAAALDIGDLEAFGTTPMVEAINLALELADSRARYLAGKNLQTGRVRILMFTDGGPNDRDLPADAWRAAAHRIAGLQQEGRVQFFAFGAPGADETVLRTMAGDNGYVPLAEFDFAKLLDLILVATSADDPFMAIRDQLGWEESAT